ncbi:MAG: T9SS type A sorting domain-containing protein [Candidatus Hatepunaea meridiana]|nr:T9SS type A sorting domain-containing protein [Candidatus Hatepunaea meridiana]
MICKFDRPFFLSLSTTRRQGNALPFGRFSPCKYLLLIILLFSQTLVNPVNAEWGRTAEDYISLPLYRDAHICSDGNGGIWATGYGIGLSHVDRDGNLTWGREPFIIQPNNASTPRPVLADNGDVIVGMDIYNRDEGLTNVFLQRINIDQELVWGEDGIQLDSSSRNEWIIKMSKGPIDDTYLIHWATRNEWNRDFDLRLQLINGDGDFLWGLGGIGLNRFESKSSSARTTLSSDQCVIAVYSTAVDDEGDMEVLKINSDGELLWGEKFSILTGSIRRKMLRDIESDREGGAILIYESDSLESVDDSVRYNGIKAMRISGDGDSLWTRHLYEREVLRGSENFGRIKPILNYAGSGRFFIAWADYPNSFQVVTLDADGEFLWDEPVDVILNPVGFGSLDAIDSGSGVCYVWRDTDPDREGITQQWGQKISAEGERLWGDRGRAIQARNVSQSSITTDGNGGIITVVEYNPTVQMINRNGEIGVVLENAVDDEVDKPKPLKKPHQLYLYPNPGNSQFRIEFDSRFLNANATYDIYDLMGRSVRSGMIGGRQYIFEDMSPFSSGEYILRLQSPRTTVSTRFLLIK